VGELYVCPWVVCMSARGWAVQTGVNQLRCCLEGWLM